jgi:hypothetical protein
MLALKAIADFWKQFQTECQEGRAKKKLDNIKWYKKGSPRELGCLPEGHHATDRWCPWHFHKKWVCKKGDPTPSFQVRWYIYGRFLCCQQQFKPNALFTQNINYVNNIAKNV